MEIYETKDDCVNKLIYQKGEPVEPKYLKLNHEDLLKASSNVILKYL